MTTSMTISNKIVVSDVHSVAFIIAIVSLYVDSSRVTFFAEPVHIEPIVSKNITVMIGMLPMIVRHQIRPVIKGMMIMASHGMRLDK